MKIILADCYHDSDKGGGGMIAGAIAAINQACEDEHTRADISLLFRFSEDDPHFATAARLTGPKFPRQAILPSPISSRRGPGIHWLSWGIRVLALGGIRLVAPTLSRHPAVVAMREADVIVLKGGNFYKSWSNNAVADWMAMVLLFYTAILARRMGKRYVFTSHTFGPFETASASQIVGKIVSGADYVSAREEKSREILLACGVPRDSIRVAPDFGFGAYPADERRARELLETHGLQANEFVAFTARPWFYAQRRAGNFTGQEQYFTGAAALLDHALDSGLQRAALIVQNDGAHSANEPDLPVLKEILKRMRHRDKAQVIDNDYAFDDLCALYGQASFMLGTRLHSCIFSFMAGTPSIAIAYSHKGQGIMHMMGMERSVLDISALSVEQGKQLVVDTIRDDKALREHIITRRPILRDALFRSVKEALFGIPADPDSAGVRAN